MRWLAGGRRELSPVLFFGVRRAVRDRSLPLFETQHLHGIDQCGAVVQGKYQRGRTSSLVFECRLELLSQRLELLGPQALVGLRCRARIPPQ